MKLDKPTFQGRSKAGRGKLFYGLTKTQLERIKLVRENESAEQASHHQNLLRFCEIYIKHARDLAKSGFKDEARNWYRFFNNSQIVSVLTDLKVSGNLAKLREDLNFLGLECHPLEPSNFTTDIESIRKCLTEILSHVQTMSPKSSDAVPCSGERGSNHSLSSHHRHG